MTHSLLNFKETTTKDIFLCRLKGVPIHFNCVVAKDIFTFIDFAIETSLIKFERHIAYRGTLGRYNILNDFQFSVDRADFISGKQYLNLVKGDKLELTEQLLSARPTRMGKPGFIITFLYVYVSKEDRKKIYDL